MQISSTTGGSTRRWRGGPDLRQATGELIETAPRGTAADAARAVAAAQAGRRAMAAMPSHERAAIIDRAADAIGAEHETLSRLLARENGKTLREVRSELDAAIRIFRGYAEEAKRVFGRATPLDSIPGQQGSLALTLRQPRGVIAAIVPFNYPAELWAHKVAAALAAGNAVSPSPPRSAADDRKDRGLLQEAGCRARRTR